MDLQLRPATSADAAFVADVATAMNPDEPVDPVVEQHHWDEPSEAVVFQRQIVELAGRQVGFLISSHLVWPPDDPVRTGWVIPGLYPDEMSPARLGQLVFTGLDWLRKEGTLLARADVWANEQEVAAALRAGGFEEDVPDRLWELDLPANRERIEALSASSRARLAAAGVRLLTVAESALPDVVDRIFEMTRLAQQDTPRTFPVPPLPRAIFDRWHGAPDVRWDRYWIAELDGEVAGLSYLRYPPVRGRVWTGFTASHRAHRGKGIALGVKMPTLVQALELGVARVRTGNDSRNAPMLAINEKLGYAALPPGITFMKKLADDSPHRIDPPVTGP